MSEQREAPIVVEHVGLPVEGLNEALPHLRRPFTPEAIRFKVQNVFSGNTGCIVVAYIDARLVIERLNAVVGGEWAQSYRPAQNDKLLLCDLTVFGVTRTDVGGSPKGASKDLVSDALKRSAVLFGVGVSVYSLPQIKLFWSAEQSVQRPALEKIGRGDKERLALTDAGHDRLRGGYGNWLAESGARLFGQPLDHGDVLTDITNGEVDQAEEPGDAAPQPVSDERGLALIQQANDLRDSIASRPGGRKRLPGGQFVAELSAVESDHTALEGFVARLGEIDSELAEADLPPAPPAELFERPGRRA